VDDGVAFRIAGVYFGKARIRTVDGNFLKTVAGEHITTVEDYTP
jgi:hypothetical protein